MVMKTLLLTSPQGKPDAREFDDLASGSQSDWKVESAPASALAKWREIADVTLVEVGKTSRPGTLKAMLPDLAAIQKRGGNRSFVVFSFKRRLKETESQLRGSMKAIRQALSNFPNPDRVEVTFAQNAPDMAAVLDVVGAKLDLGSRDGGMIQIERPRPSPLDQIKEVLAASKGLRVTNGNLSAEAVSRLYGISLSQLAGWLGRSRQALTKTPDAESLQGELGWFERIARLRMLLADDAEFRKWLRMPNPQLDGEKPLRWLEQKRWQDVAGLVEDLLTGAPA